MIAPHTRYAPLMESACTGFGRSQVEDPIRTMHQAEDIRRLTEVSKNLQRFGYTFTFDAETADNVIILADYPHRPQPGLFQRQDITAPVGATWEVQEHYTTTEREYTLHLPERLGGDMTAATSLDSLWLSLQAHADDFNRQHGTTYPAATVIPLMHALVDDDARILLCLSYAIPGKKVLDMFNLGYTFDAVIALRNIPVSLIFDGGRKSR